MGQESVGHINLTFKAYREDAQWVAECVELGTASCGDSIEKAFDALTDATEVYLQALEDEGERDRIFKLRDITIIPGSPDEDRTATRTLTIAVRPHEVISRHELAIPAGVA